MPRRYNNNRPDANHKDVIGHLRNNGICVADLSGNQGGVSDVVTHFLNQTVFIEIKSGPKAVLKKTQVLFLGTWQGWCGIARTPEEALSLAMYPNRYALIQQEQELLLLYHKDMKDKSVHLNTILKYIGR